MKIKEKFNSIFSGNNKNLRLIKIIVAVIVAIVLAFFGKPLIVVAIAACVAAFAAGFLPF